MKHTKRTAIFRISRRLVALPPLAAILIAVATLTPASLAIPAAPQKDHDTPHAKPKDVVVTGCLFRRDRPGEFALTTRDAKLFYVESSTVDLAAHVRHTVTITGTFAPDSASQNDPDKSPEAQTIIASKLEMISKTCH